MINLCKTTMYTPTSFTYAFHGMMVLAILLVNPYLYLYKKRFARLFEQFAFVE